MMTVKLYGGDLGEEVMYVRCDLANPAAPVTVDYDNGEGFVGTQYQCAHARHTVSGLAKIGQQLAAIACEVEADLFDCDWFVFD